MSVSDGITESPAAGRQIVIASRRCCRFCCCCCCGHCCERARAFPRDQSRKLDARARERTLASIGTPLRHQYKPINVRLCVASARATRIKSAALASRRRRRIALTCQPADRASICGCLRACALQLRGRLEPTQPAAVLSLRAIKTRRNLHTSADAPIDKRPTAPEPSEQCARTKRGPKKFRRTVREGACTK